MLDCGKQVNIVGTSFIRIEKALSLSQVITIDWDESCRFWQSHLAQGNSTSLDLSHWNSHFLVNTVIKECTLCNLLIYRFYYKEKCVCHVFLT